MRQTFGLRILSSRHEFGDKSTNSESPYYDTEKLITLMYKKILAQGLQQNFRSWFLTLDSKIDL